MDSYIIFHLICSFYISISIWILVEKYPNYFSTFDHQLALIVAYIIAPLFILLIIVLGTYKYLVQKERVVLFADNASST